MDALATDTPRPQPPAHAPAGPPAAPRPAERILIVRPSALGDVSRTVPALVTLRRAYPHARIDWLVQRGFADAVRNHPDLTTVIPFDRDWLAKLPRRQSSVRGGLGFAYRLRRTRYDAVYDLQGLFRSGLFTLFTGAARRVGFADARELGWLGYNVRHRVPPETRHTVDRMLALLERDGFHPVRDLRLYLGEEETAWRQAFVRDHALTDGYACVAPTARWGSKMWPLDRYAEIARRLLQTGLAGDRLVVLASPGERAQVQAAFARLGPLAERLVFPTTTVGQMMAVLSATRLLVCNDSAPLHVAVGFGRPVVALFGPTDPLEVGPYGRLDAVVRPDGVDPDEASRFSYRAHRDDPSLISRIAIEQVWAKVQATLASSSDGR